MPAARGVKRSASKASASTASSAAAAKTKKKRGPTQLEIPSAPTKRGRVLTCGQGDVGQLGLGEDVTETTRFKFVAALGDKIVDVKAGGMHTIALDSDGKIWTFGCNDEGALGRPTGGEGEESTPGKVTLPGKAVAISAGDSHSAALLQNGEVYAWGSFRDSHGSMGLVISGRGGAPCASPHRIALGEAAAAIASGGDHLLALTVSGGVLSVGCGEQGQLGRLSQRSASRDARGGFSALLSPGKVPLKTSCSSVWAAHFASFAADAAAGRLLAWGLNNYGQLGISGEKRKVALYSPAECDAFQTNGNLVSVSAGQHHTIALDSEGTVYTIGRCEYGRLGLGGGGDAAALAAVPALAGKRCVSVAAATASSFAVTDAGEIYAWGMGSEGQLGTGKSEDSDVPLLATGLALKDLKAVAVAAGGQHTVVLAVDPNRVETESPTCEAEPVEAEIAVEAEKAEEDEKVAEKDGPRPHKRQKKEDEVSSTTEDEKSEKVNGNEKKETAMEVDETDSTQQETETDKDKTSDSKSEQTKMDQEPTQETSTDSKTEKTETPEITEEDITEKPTAEKPTAEKTTAEKLTAEKPTAEKTTAEIKETDVEMSEKEINGEKEGVVTTA